MLTNLPSPGFNYHRLVGYKVDPVCWALRAVGSQMKGSQYLVCFWERAQMCVTVPSSPGQVIPDKSHF